MRISAIYIKNKLYNNYTYWCVFKRNMYNILHDLISMIFFGFGSHYKGSIHYRYTNRAHPTTWLWNKISNTKLQQMFFSVFSQLKENISICTSWKGHFCFKHPSSKNKNKLFKFFWGIKLRFLFQNRKFPLKDRHFA